MPGDVRGVGAAVDGGAGPGTAGPAAVQADAEGGGGVSGAATSAGCAGDSRFRRHRLAGGGDEQPCLYGRRQPGQGDGADLGPARAVGGVVAGDDVTGAGQAQPARRRGGHLARQARGITGVVPLHSCAVAAGNHDSRVRRALAGARGDDQPCLRPRHHRGLGADRLSVQGQAAFGQFGQRGHFRRDAAVAGQRAVHEVEGVGHRLAAGTGRDDVTARRAVRASDTGCYLAVTPLKQAEQDGHQHRDHDGNDPAANSPELGPLGVQQVREAGPAGLAAGREGVIVVMTPAPPARPDPRSGTRPRPW